MKVVVLISGSGTNLQALIDSSKDYYKIQCVISNRPDAYGLVRAKQAGIPTQVIDHTTYPSRDAFELELKAYIDTLNPDLIVLAGFMRRLGPDISNYYAEKMINIHPSLLPKFPGLHTFKKALENHETEHGCTIHYVTPDVDCGPIIAQARFSINETDSIESLKKKTQTIEHQLYPLVLKLIARQKIHIENQRVFYENKPLPATGLQYSEKNLIK